MPAPAGNRGGLAIHIGADTLTWGPFAQRIPLRSCRDTVERMSRLCAAAGVSTQTTLLGEDADRGGVRRAIGGAVHRLAPNGLLVLTFAGHSSRSGQDAAGRRDTSWCLHDAPLRLREVVGMLTMAPRDALVVVVADTCFAASFAQVIGPDPATVLLAACGKNQTTLDRTTSEFIERLERLVPASPSHTWLQAELVKDTPDAERPFVWTNRAGLWEHRPALAGGRAVRVVCEPHGH